MKIFKESYRKQWIRRNAKKIAKQNNIKNYIVLAHGVDQYSIQDTNTNEVMRLPKVQFTAY